jgi:hypothetical protein
MLYVNTAPGQTFVAVPLIAPGVAGMLYTASVRDVLKPKQFCERTLKVPLVVKFDAYDTVTVCVPWPDTIVALVGAVH